MSDALSFAEIDGQRVELLPARTVLSMFSTGGSCGGCTGGAAPGGSGATGQGVTTGAGGPGKGEVSFFHNFFYLEDGNVTNNVTGGVGGAGGAVNGH